MLAEIFFYGIVVYLIYKILFDFVLPVSNASKQMKQQFRNMNEHMRQQQQNNYYQEQNTQQNNSPRKSEKVEGDYIDFEEVKK